MKTYITIAALLLASRLSTGCAIAAAKPVGRQSSQGDTPEQAEAKAERMRFKRDKTDCTAKAGQAHPGKGLINKNRRADFVTERLEGLGWEME